MYFISGERPYVCPVTECARSFMDLSNFRKHVDKLHGPNATNNPPKQTADATGEWKIQPTLSLPGISYKCFTIYCKKVNFITMVVKGGCVVLNINV